MSCASCRATFTPELPTAPTPAVASLPSAAEFNAALNKQAPFIAQRLRSTANRVCFSWMAVAAVFAALGATMLSSDLGLGGGFFLIATLLVGMGIHTLRKGRDPARHQVIKELAAWGNPLEVCAEIQSEIDAAPLRHVKFSCFTKSWILYDEASAFFAIPIQEVVWGYRSEHQTRSNTGTYTDHALVVYTVRGASYRLEFGTGLKSANYFLDLLAKRVPWMQVGFSSELQDAWFASPEAFITEVIQRRISYHASRAAPADRKRGPADV